MKETTLATISAESMPKNLRHLISVLPQATWNGYNVWMKSSDKTRMKSLGFAYSKNGKHAGQWFTNERLQKSLTRKQEKVPQKSNEPAKAQPKTTPEESHEPKEICCVAKFDKVYNAITTENHYLIIRAKNCTGIEQIISWFVKDPVKNLACRKVENLSIETLKVYKTDSAFLAQARKKFNVPQSVKVKTIDFTPKSTELEVEMGIEDCAILEWDDLKTKKHMINLFRIKNGTVTNFKKYMFEKLQREELLGAENLSITQTRYYDTDQKFINAFERMKDYKGKDFLRVVQTFDMAAHRENAA